MRPYVHIYYIRGLKRNQPSHQLEPTQQPQTVSVFVSPPAKARNDSTSLTRSHYARIRWITVFTIQLCFQDWRSSCTPGPVTVLPASPHTLVCTLGHKLAFKSHYQSPCFNVKLSFGRISPVIWCFLLLKFLATSQFLQKTF